MKNSKITKKEIHITLTNGNTTQIHALASKLGIDTKNKSAVFNFIKNNAKTQKSANRALGISYGRADFKHFRCYKGAFENIFREPTQTAIKLAKQYKTEDWGNYTKKLFLGDKNIYWCHPSYGHSDYNKSIAFENNERNRKVAEIINRYLGYN